MVTFVIEEIENELLSHAIVQKFDIKFTIYLKDKYKPGFQIESYDFSPIAFIYADIMNKRLLNLNNRDIFMN